MPNHWHLVLWPMRDGELGKFVQRLTTTHVRRWHLNRHSVGNGHLYQGTYKSFPVQDDNHFLAVCRYVERNPLRAKLVDRAEGWRWSSFGLRATKTTTELVLSEWPAPRPVDWLTLVNETTAVQELETLRLSAQRGRPFGNEGWQLSIAERLGLDPRCVCGADLARSARENWTYPLFWLQLKKLGGLFTETKTAAAALAQRGFLISCREDCTFSGPHQTLFPSNLRAHAVERLNSDPDSG